jgi:hypothetical protein
MDLSREMMSTVMKVTPVWKLAAIQIRDDGSSGQHNDG